MVSVVIPNYNHSQYLEQRIESVLNQTYKNLEIIILDDSSSDDSKKVIEKYRCNSKVSHIIYNNVNSGSTFKQWQKGISLSKGEYIWIAESDDWCEPVMLENLMVGFANNSRCVISYCQSYCIEAENKIKFQSNHYVLSEFINGRKFISEYILPRNPIFNASMAVWKRDIFFKISTDFVNYKFCGDLLFWIELSMWGDVFISGKALNYFRSHQKNVSGPAFKNGLNFIEGLAITSQLLTRGIINNNDFELAVKRYYFLFKKTKSILEEGKSLVIKKLFLDQPVSVYQLKKYYMSKNLQAYLKRTLRF